MIFKNILAAIALAAGLAQQTAAVAVGPGSGSQSIVTWDKVGSFIESINPHI